jgi:hypothetical protein
MSSWEGQMLVRNAAVVLTLDLRCSSGEQINVHRPVRPIALRRADVSTDVACNVRSRIAGVRGVVVWRRDVGRAELRSWRGVYRLSLRLR